MNPKQAYGDKKPPLSLMPLSAMIAGTMAFYDGAGKYGRLNWRENPVEAMTYVEAILRHILLWANGEENARDTTVPNLGGVIASASLLYDAQTNGVLIDNRVFSQANCDLLHEAEGLLERIKAQHVARRAALDADEEARKAIEGHKREMAEMALVSLQDLIDRWWDGNGPVQKEVEPRIAAAKDLILNMVNGVFPEYHEQMVDALHDISDVTIRDEQDNDWTEPDLGHIKSPTVDEVYPKLDPIPKGFYYFDGNFYRLSDQTGAGWDFYNQWCYRAAEFPQSITQANEDLLGVHRTPTGLRPGSQLS